MKTKFILVDTISQYRMRYLVEVPEDKYGHALALVAQEQVKEFSQLHLGETIVSYRAVSEKEAIEQFKSDNNYLAKWSDEQILATALTPYDS